MSTVGLYTHMDIHVHSHILERTHIHKLILIDLFFNLLSVIDGFEQELRISYQ